MQAPGRWRGQGPLGRGGPHRPHGRGQIDPVVDDEHGPMAGAELAQGRGASIRRCVLGLLLARVRTRPTPASGLAATVGFELPRGRIAGSVIQIQLLACELAAASVRRCQRWPADPLQGRRSWHSAGWRRLGRPGTGSLLRAEFSSTAGASCTRPGHWAGHHTARGHGAPAGRGVPGRAAIVALWQGSFVSWRGGSDPAAGRIVRAARHQNPGDQAETARLDHAGLAARSRLGSIKRRTWLSVSGKGRIGWHQAASLAGIGLAREM